MIWFCAFDVWLLVKTQTIRPIYQTGVHAEIQNTRRRSPEIIPAEWEAKEM